VTDAIAAIATLSNMLDTLDVALCLFDAEDRTLLWNGAFLRLFPEHDGHVFVGETYAANLRRFYQGRLDSNEIANIDRYIADGIARHRAQSLPFEFTHRDQWIRVASLPVPGIGRARVWAPVTTSGETDRLARILPDFGRRPVVSAIDDIADGLMIRDPHGVILSVNRRFVMIHRLGSDADAVGGRFPDLIATLWGDHPGCERALMALRDNARFPGAPFEVALPQDRWVRVSEHRAPDGGTVSTHVDVTDLYRLQRATIAAQHKAEALAMSLREQIAERERAEAALRQTMRVEAIGQLTGGVAHDFNNLLSVMLGNVELLGERITDRGQRQTLDIIRGAVERGSALMRQLLAFARRQPLMPRPTALGEMVQDMLPLLRSACGSRIDLRVIIPEALPEAQVDPIQLELVILNLVINARDAMPQGGTLTLRGDLVTLPASPETDAPVAGRYLRLSVIDTGTGMTEEVRARAFEPFFTTKGPGGGSGLGLSQAFGMARQSGGTVQIDSNLGVGTGVHVMLPCAEAKTETVDLPEQALVVPKTSVLLVDDDPGVLNTFTELLRFLGYRVTPASGAAPALEALENGLALDILITDVIMPGLRGPDLAQRVWETRVGLPVIFISGFADPELVPLMNTKSRMLRKPCRAAELTAAITALVERTA